MTISHAHLNFASALSISLRASSSIEALRGTLVHAVLESTSNDVPALERTPEHAQNLLEPTWAAHVEKAPQSRELFESVKHLQEWLGSARTLIANYFKLENPTFLQPAAREEFVNAGPPLGTSNSRNY